MDNPVAWLHTLHMELGQTCERLMDWDGSDADEPHRTAFGLPGRDYSEEYTVTTVPLYPATALAAKDAEIERLREALKKAGQPQWFYADGYSSEDCRDSPDEVLEYLDLAPGTHVISIDCAGPLPSIWCAVRVTDDEDADERFTFTEHATEADARAALSEQRS